MVYVSAPISRFESLDDVVRFVQQEFEKLGSESAQPEVNFLKLDVLHAAPEKPRNGMLAVADGTDWVTGTTNEELVVYLNGSGGDGWYRFATSALP